MIRLRRSLALFSLSTALMTAVAVPAVAAGDPARKPAPTKPAAGAHPGGAPLRPGLLPPAGHFVPESVFGTAPGAASGQLKGPTLLDKPQADDGSGDPVYGAYQRGFYLAAFALAIPRAEAGDTAAMTMLGLLYESGAGVPAKLDKAAEWYRLGAAKGDREAAVALGQMTIQGRGVAKDPKRAFELFRQAAEKDQPIALFNGAMMLLDGKVVPRDEVKAAKWLARAAELGNIEAQYAWASLLADREYPGHDEREAARWMREAAMSGFEAAEIDFALMLVNGRGVRKSPEDAYVWFRRSALRGNAIGRNRLARMYAVGLGVDPDPVAAWTWHTLAVRQGLPDIWLETQLSGLTAEQKKKAELEADRISASGDSFAPLQLEETPADPAPAAPTAGAKQP